MFRLRNRAVGRHRKVKLGDWRQPWLRVAGALLLVVSAGIHLDLYLTGYRSIPTIGWLFLVQFLVAFVLAVGALVTHSRLVAVAGAAFALSTLGCYLLAVWIGLFGYKEIRTRAGIAAGLIEVAAFATLALAVAIAGARQAAAAGPAAGPGCWPGCGPRSRWWSVRSAPSRSPPWSCSASRWPARAGAARERRGHRGHPEDRHDRRGHRPHQRQGPHAVLVRPRHPDRLQVHRVLCRLLAAGHRHPRGRARA